MNKNNNKYNKDNLNNMNENNNQKGTLNNYGIIFKEIK